MNVAVANTVASREQLGTAIVSIPQPAVVNKFETPEGTPYEQFGIPVSGGYINFHLFDRALCQTRGKKIWVEAQVWKKVMTDGKEFLYVDLYPTAANERPTHDRKIFQRTAEVPDDLPEESLRFDCFGRINGSIVFVPRVPHAADE